MGELEHNPAEARSDSARRIAAIFGRDKRAVLKWADKGCPHRVDTSGRQARKFFDPVEVREWLVEQGLPVQPDPGGGETSPGSLTDPPASSGDEGDQDPELAVEAERLGAELLGDGDKAFNTMAGGCARILSQVASKKSVGSMSSQQLSQISSAVKGASAELRGLMQAKREHDEATRSRVDRVEAETLMYDAVRSAVRAFEAIAGDAPRMIAHACTEAGIEISDPDSFSRIAGDTLRKQLDTIRRRQADAMESQADKFGADDET